MPQLTKNLIRLDASSYHGPSFVGDEEALAREFGLSYFFKLGQFDASQNAKELEDQSFVLISNTHTIPAQIPKEILKRTELWIHSNSGYDNFEASFVESAPFPIITGNPIRCAAVTEYILAQVLENFGLINHQAKWDKSRLWDRPLLKKKNILICGEGLIGTALRECLTPLSHQVTTFDPFKKENQSRGLAELLKEFPPVDILLLACSLNSTSKNLIDENIINLLNKDFLLVNAARGSLVDEKALFSHLSEHKSARAILDVFASEPTPEDFIDLKNLKRTSHIAGVSKNLDRDILDFEREVITSFVTNKEKFNRDYESLFLSNRISKKELI